MVSQKISEFNSVTGIPDSALITYVINGTNVNIAYSDLKSALGVTGTLNQTGDPLGVPVLQANGDDYEIRNIESSKGVIANVSAQNGIVIGANFTQTGSGSKVITDTNSDIYNFKTIAAGTNISLGGDDENIIVNFSGESGSTKTVAISVLADFPAPVSDVITLDPNVDYLLLDDITSPYEFKTVGDNTLRGASSQIVKLTYSGTGTLLTGVESNFRASGMTFSAPTGQLFDFSNASSTGTFQVIECNAEECDTIGTFNNMFIVRFDSMGWEDIKTTGMTFSGTILNLSLDTAVLFLNGGTFIDLGTSVNNELSIARQVVQPTSDPAAIFIDGLIDSGNILPGGLGTVTGNRCAPLTSPTNNIIPEDNRFEFIGNSNIADSLSDGLMWDYGNIIETVITTTGVSVKIDNTWTLEVASRFEFDSSGRLTYTGERAERLPIDIACTLLAASGGDKQASMCIAINGTVVPATCKQATINNSKAASVSTIWQHEFQQGDYVEVFVANEDNTINIVVEQIIMRIN